MKYKYTGNGNFYQGLPATDLDDSTLSDNQKVLLAAGTARGMYTPVSEPKPKKEEKPSLDGEKQS